MALGIEFLANNRVVGESELGSDVRAAAIERRWSPATAQSEHDGDRLYVTTPTELRAYDVPSRTPVAAVPGDFHGLAVDEAGHRLFVARADGEIQRVATDAFDSLRRDSGANQPVLEPFARPTDVSGPFESLYVAPGKVVAR